MGSEPESRRKIEERGIYLYFSFAANPCLWRLWWLDSLGQYYANMNGRAHGVVCGTIIRAQHNLSVVLLEIQLKKQLQKRGDF